MVNREGVHVAKKLEPLQITCTTTDCEDDRHCFLQKKRRESHAVPGPCRECGAELVEWKRVHLRDPGDTAYTFESLHKEAIRHEFWHREFDQKAINHARRKGRIELYKAVIQRLQTSIGRKENPREGRQTPMHGNTIYYAQHALACCCRRCVEYWHGIESGRELFDEELGYLVSLVTRYLDKRLPWLNQEPERVPPLRRSK